MFVGVYDVWEGVNDGSYFRLFFLSFCIYVNAYD